MQTIKARIAEGHEDMLDVHHVEVFGHHLGKDYREIEVSDDVLDKLKGNSAIDVMVKGPAGASTAAKPAAEKPAE